MMASMVVMMAEVRMVVAVEMGIIYDVAVQAVDAVDDAVVIVIEVHVCAVAVSVVVNSSAADTADAIPMLMEHVVVMGGDKYGNVDISSRSVFPSSRSRL